MTRTKPYYSLRTVKNCIANKKVQITQQALKTAQEDFSWGKNEIYKAILSLRTKDWYKSSSKYNDPNVWVDYYKCYDLKGEKVYIHFSIQNNFLIIDSFKRL